MSYKNTLDDVKETLMDLLNNKKLHITDETKASDVPGWDSVFHIELMVALEDKFDIKFLSSELTDFQSVKELCQLIEAKQ